MKLLQTYKADLLNGEGLRDVYFFSGCELHCPQCFSPETWDPDTSLGKEWISKDFEELIQNASKSYISGITLLGGDPFHPINRDDILKLCMDFKKKLPNKTIWIYTGYTWEIIEKSKDSRWECLKYIDVLCDGLYIDKLKSPNKPWVGSENQRVIDVQESLKQNKIILY